MIAAALAGRIGGLAVAFGVGTAIAGACAATASAAPSGDRPGVSRDDASDHGARASSRRAHQPIERPTRSRGESTVAKAAASAPARTTTVRAGAATPASNRQRPAEAMFSVETAPAQDTPASATTAAPTASTTKARFGDPRGRLVTIYKGTHFAIPNRWALWVKKVTGDATFIPDSAYDLKDADQYDWNKLAGITFTPWRPERNASMVVWRYNLQSEQFEVGPFWDVDFAYVFPTDDEIISVPVGQTFSYAVDYDGITVTYGDTTVFKPTPQELSPNFLTSARITGWFGGSEVAPRTVSYYLHMR